MVSMSLQTKPSFQNNNKKTYACITEPKLTVCGAVIVGQKKCNHNKKNCCLNVRREN